MGQFGYMVLLILVLHICFEPSKAWHSILIGVIVAAILHIDSFLYQKED